MYRISVTTLEKFRRFMAEVSSYDTEQSLIDSITGGFIGNEKTDIGEGYHSLIEGDFSSEREHFKAGKFLFTPEQARAAFQYKREHKSMIHEVTVSKVYVIPGYEINVRGRIDGVEGMQLRDIKTKFSSIDFQEYYNSYQWRFYLDMLGLDAFWYDIFEVTGFDHLTGSAPYKLPDVSFLAPEPFVCYSYPSMHQDCRALLNDFMGWIRERNFFHLLKTEPVVPAH